MSESSAPAGRTFTLASRGSQLAQIQTNIVLSSLRTLTSKSASSSDASGAPQPQFNTQFMTTAGDRNQSQALYLMGGKALWTKDLEVALLDSSVDMLIHSLKDVPTVMPAGCTIGAILEREDPVDSLVVKKEGKGSEWTRLEEFEEGSVIGTSSVRRVAQLKRNFPKLKFMDVVSDFLFSLDRRSDICYDGGREEICTYSILLVVQSTRLIV